MQQERALRYSKRTLKRMLDIKSDETMRKLVNTGALAKPIKDSQHGPCYWLAEDVDAYISALAQKRQQDQPGTPVA